ncbi:MAG TPA: threonine--tRNA ligase [Longimicrobium sp.]|jgi:threonyl-tRNA synthetase|uniref:threonine--tRNA ligase n=1 Tax=Longimicrobium sp. TaxID=2029185 RepID=UPI002ED92A6C
MSMTHESMDPVRVTLPDGSVREVPRGAPVRAVAEAIGARLARAALAARVDGRVVDLARPLESDATVEIITETSPGALELLRHSAAHVLATAVRRVRPEAGIGFGPSIDSGFYYDFQIDTPFTPDELERIEKEMDAVARADDPFERRVVSRDEARELFAGDPLKLERLEELGPDETITVYCNGPFLDLCRGPHLPSTGRLKHFKLLNTAGAYWRGDEKRQMLQRIYGTAFFSREDLEQHLHQLEEARKRDHRRLGRQLDLFMFHPYAPGAAFWTHKGTLVYHLLGEWMREVLMRNGYDAVKTPLLFNKGLWETSGHWGVYRENMFLVLDNETGEHDMSLKPMNCPSHHLMYAARKRSYRELPVRYSTQDVLHRNEVSGALSGLTRVRQFAQDDAHVYLAEAQIEDEVRRMVALIDYFYGTLGLEYTARFATRPEERLGDDAMWDRAEGGLRAALEATGLAYEMKPGDGAFYGPKIDFDVSDSIGRKWQLGTIQLDYAAPERFELAFTGDDNQEHRPVVIHRAFFGSFERFIAILIEHFAGAFPVWLAPVQVVAIPISAEQAESAHAFAAALREQGIRVDVDDRNETLNYRVREAEMQKVPYMAVIGGREAAGGTAAVRVRGAGRKQEVVARDELAARIVEQVRTRTLRVGFGDAEEESAS